MSDATENGRETGTSSESSLLAESFTPAALFRSIALSLMDTADRIAEWLEPRETNEDEHDPSSSASQPPRPASASRPRERRAPDLRSDAEGHATGGRSPSASIRRD